MSVVEFQRPMDRRSVRARLFNPPNGRESSEREIASDAELRRRRVQELKQQDDIKRAEEDFRRRAAIDDLMRKELEDHNHAKVIAAKIFVEEGGRIDTEPPIIAPNERPPTLRAIVHAVARYYGVSVLLVMSDHRLKRLVRPRFVSYYLCHELTGKSMSEIGRRFNGRDHTTILHGWETISDEIKTDKNLAADIAIIRRELADG